MRKPLVFVFLLSACATPVLNERALPEAIAVHQLAIDRCGARITNREISKMQELTECHNAAKRQFAADIKLQEEGLVFIRIYEERMLLAAQDYDAGGIPFDDFIERSRRTERDLVEALGMILSRDREDRARQSAALIAFGAGLQGLGGYNRPQVNCTTLNNPFGSSTSCQ